MLICVPMKCQRRQPGRPGTLRDGVYFGRERTFVVNLLAHTTYSPILDGAVSTIHVEECIRQKQTAACEQDSCQRRHGQASRHLRPAAATAGVSSTGLHLAKAPHRLVLPVIGARHPELSMESHVPPPIRCVAIQGCGEGEGVVIMARLNGVEENQRTSNVAPMAACSVRPIFS